MKFDKIYPLDAMFDTPDVHSIIFTFSKLLVMFEIKDVPEDIKTNKRYAGSKG